MTLANDDICCGVGNGDIAKNKVLQHLIKLGKISVDDAKSAIQATGVNCNGTNKKSKKSAAESKSQQVGKYRTRHVALQFSYDGTNFSGFAQNVGKEEDNSVEKVFSLH